MDNNPSDPLFDPWSFLEFGSSLDDDLAQMDLAQMDLGTPLHGDSTQVQSLMEKQPGQGRVWSLSSDLAGPSSDNAHHAHSYMTTGFDFNRTMANTDAAAPTTAHVSPSDSPNTLDHSPVDEARAQPANSARRTSNPKRRQLVPQPRAPRISPRDSVTTLSALHTHPGPSQPGVGPASKEHVMVPRPKPGRKPATDEPASKRKAQNRDSQRSFRARKAARTVELNNKISAQEQQHKERTNQLLNDIEHLKQEVQKGLENGQYWRQEYHNLRDAHQSAPMPLSVHTSFNNHSFNNNSFNTQPFNSQSFSMAYPMNPMNNARHESPTRASSSNAHAYATPNTVDAFGCDRCEPDHCACISEIANDIGLPDADLAPMDSVPLRARNCPSPMTGILRGGGGDSDETDDFADQEIDFTAKFASVTAFAKVQDCGFCQGRDDICYCKGASLGADAEDAMTPPSSMTPRSPVEDVKPNMNMAMTGPGTCADCIVNPDQRAWCKGVAENSVRQLRHDSATKRNSSFDVMEPNAKTSIDMDKADPLPGRGERTIGCSDAFKLFEGRVSTDPDKMDWRHLKPVPRDLPSCRDTSGFTMEPGMYSAMELDASSILTTLSSSHRPLQPRASDGSHAHLVQEAEERRRVSFSPRTIPSDAEC